MLLINILYGFYIIEECGLRYGLPPTPHMSRVIGHIQSEYVHTCVVWMYWEYVYALRYCVGILFWHSGTKLFAQTSYINIITYYYISYLYTCSSRLLSNLPDVEVSAQRKRSSMGLELTMTMTTRKSKWESGTWHGNRKRKELCHYAFLLFSFASNTCGVPYRIYNTLDALFYCNKIYKIQNVAKQNNNSTRFVFFMVFSRFLFSSRLK